MKRKLAAEQSSCPTTDPSCMSHVHLVTVGADAPTTSIRIHNSSDIGISGILPSASFEKEDDPCNRRKEHEHDDEVTATRDPSVDYPPHAHTHAHAHAHSKQMIRRIKACGNNYTKALDILYEMQPFLRTNTAMSREDLHIHSNPPQQQESFLLDAKPIVTVIQLLAKNHVFSTPMDLLSTVIQQYQKKIIPPHYLISVYKAIIGMLALQEQKEKVHVHRQILRYIYTDIPHHIHKAAPLDVYHVALSALGKCRQMTSIMDLLNRMETSQPIILLTGDELDVRNASSMGEEVYRHPMPDRMAYLTALNSGIRCKSPSASMEIMNRMIARGIKPDTVAYNHVLSSLASVKMENRCELVKGLWEQMEKENLCTDSTYKSLIHIFTKECRWSDVVAVRECMDMQRLGKKEDARSSTNGNVLGNLGEGKVTLTSAYIEDLEKLEKNTVCKKPWYKLGKVQGDHLNHLPNCTLVFGIQQHKNPILNGLSLVFYTVTGEKLGYMLIRNEIRETPHLGNLNDHVTEEQQQQQQQQQQSGDDGKIFLSSIMGMFIDDCHRGKGLAQLFLGVWVTICLRTNAFPRSEKINKPLLSLVLSKFGFIPICESAIEAEICPIEHVQEDTCAMGPIADLSWKPQFALYTTNAMMFAERELRIQKMIVTRLPPCPRGKVIAVKTCFEHPMTHNAMNGKDFLKERTELAEFVEALWKGVMVDSNSTMDRDENCGVDFCTHDALLKRVIFGYLY